MQARAPLARLWPEADHFFESPATAANEIIAGIAFSRIGLRRRDIAALVAAEGAAMGLTAVLYGLALGAVQSLVLIYVVNRQSFHWSLELHWPLAELALASVALIAASALTAALAARAATGERALSAVREDW